LVFPLRRPAGFGHMAAFLVSVALSFLIVAAINFAVGTFALRLQSILGLLRAKFFLLELFSGLLLPMTFFPQTAQRILAFMPFQYISYIPMLIYLGKLSGGRLARAIGIQILWVGILLAIGDGLWRWSTRKVIIQGG
jgi:ABC-2 type transport system permease protein